MGAGPKDAARGYPEPPAANSLPQRATLFNFDAQGVRVVGTFDSPLFIAKDICAALEIGNSRQALATLEDDEKGVITTDTLGGPQELATVNESGLYALIFRSRKPSARLFRRWVTGEVLPAIRRAGSYRAAPAAAPVASAATLALPTPPSLDGHVAQVLLAAIAFPRDFGLVHPVEIARAAVVEKKFVELCDDPADPQKVSRLLRFITARFQKRWLRADNGCLVYLEPLSKNRHRRYSITARREVAS